MSCTSLKEMPIISKNVQNMYQTFFKCTNLSNINNIEIPSSVNNLEETFSECTNLSGTLIINADINDINQCHSIFPFSS